MFTRRLQPGARRPRRAFTLVELLVVVAIVAALIALLIPSTNRAIGLARRAACLSNLRQCQLAFFNYQIDYKNPPMPYPGSSAGAFPKFWMGLVRLSTDKVDALRRCPSTSINKSGVGVGSATLCWTGEPSPNTWINNGAGDYYIGSYAYNGWLYTGGTGYIAGTSFDRWNRTGGCSRANVPLFIDAIWVDMWAANSDRPSTDLKDPYGAGSFRSNGGLVRAAIDRHFMAVNVATLDGSARSVPLADLWDLSWSRTFVPGLNKPTDLIR